MRMIPSTISILSKWIKVPFRFIHNHAWKLFSYGDRRFCPVCETTSRRFATYGETPRDDAECPRCGALERHRFMWLYLSQKTNLFDGKAKTILHIAPEACLAARFRQCLGLTYITADLSNPRAMVKMDITNIEYPDQSFDAILCSHVLEHVSDDRKAMQELHRVLKSDGWAILLVPITAETTYEDFSIVDPQERRKAFGQHDHVRRYGPDYLDRLRDAGFRVEVTTVSHLFQKDAATRMGLTPASGDIYTCTR